MRDSTSARSRPRAFGASAPAPGRELLSGQVERVTYHNEENGFCVLRLQVRGARDLVTVVGHAASVSPGELIQASGEWVNDRTHGRQFRASHLHAAAPATAEGIQRYLGSGLVPGIGPQFAARLVSAFGGDVFTVIEQAPERLREVPGIGPLRAARIVEAWAAQRAVRDIMIFLHEHGMGTSRAVRIHRTYGADAIGLIREDPYRLARDIRGIGFLTADKVAERLGIARDAMVRVRAGLGHVLAEALDEGHCGLKRDELLDRAAALLGVDRALATEALEQELEAGALVADTLDGVACVFLAGLHRAERQLARALRALAAGRPPWPAIDPSRAIPWVERKLGVELAPSQREALALALRSRVIVITGGPGVGKTTLLRSVLAILAAKGVRPALCAPTGRAARRLAEVTGFEARTVHRLLEVDPNTGSFRRTEYHPLDCDLVVVDEASMLDVPLAAALCRAIGRHAALVLVGDVDQLPSVGPGQVLADIIESGVVPVVRLTEVFRQAGTSRIVVNAHRINRGELPDLAADGPSDFYFVAADTPADAARKIVSLVRERIPSRFGVRPIADIQVLCPMNRGEAGARALNEALQAALNPPGELRVTRFGMTFAPGDKVMQIENDYDREVYNGDIGIVSAIDIERGELTVDVDGRPVVYGFDDLDRLVLAYATTVHKAQGSEYPVVVVPVTTQHWPMLQRRLIYTAVTRARQLLVLVGQVRALAIAVRGRQDVQRWSKLRDRLREG